jgi:hypothetical protein
MRRKGAVLLFPLTSSYAEVKSPQDQAVAVRTCNEAGDGDACFGHDDGSGAQIKEAVDGWQQERNPHP